MCRMCLAYLKQKELIQKSPFPYRALFGPHRRVDDEQQQSRYYCVIRTVHTYSAVDHSICLDCYYRLRAMRADFLHIYQEGSYHTMCGVSGCGRATHCQECDREIAQTMPTDFCPECIQRLTILTPVEMDRLDRGLSLTIYH
jgi:hypothetical protein